jgi:hypothetical protein
MNKMRQLGAPRRGVVWASSPAAFEFPDSSDYDNNYAAANKPSAERGSQDSKPRKTAATSARRPSIAAFFHTYLAGFRHVVLG